MKTRRMRNLLILWSVIVILFGSSFSAAAQPPSGYCPQGLFHLMFVINISWNASQLEEPITPGETREVNLTITYVVTYGLYGRLLLRLLEGKSFPLYLTILNTSKNCTVWITPENMTGFIDSDEVGYQQSSVFIHVNENASGNYSLGWVKIRGTIPDKKGPFNILTLIQGYENDFTLTFIFGP